MAVKIDWQPPLIPEIRKRAQWEKIIRHELGELDDPLDVTLHFEEEVLRWKLDALPSPATPRATEYRGRLVEALRAHGKPVV